MESKKTDIENLKYLIANLNSMIGEWEKNKKKEQADMKRQLDEGQREVEKCKKNGYDAKQIANTIAVEITDPKAIYEERIAECQQHIDELDRERQEYIKQLKELTGSDDIGAKVKVTEFASNSSGGKQKLIGCLIWIVILAVIFKACGII